jgi:vacuolar-type H+-ATPase subunit E/Vma4
MEALLAQIKERLEQRLSEIRQTEEASAHRMQDEAKARLDAMLDERRQQRMHEIMKDQGYALNKVQEANQTRLWTFEKQAIGELESAIRERLSRQPIDEQRLHQWLHAGRARLGGSGTLVLETKPDWAASLAGLEEMEIRTGNMLGGAMLTDSGSGRQIDGSWDARLADLLPEIRQRWRKDVGADQQD